MISFIYCQYTFQSVKTPFHPQFSILLGCATEQVELLTQIDITTTLETEENRKNRVSNVIFIKKLLNWKKCEFEMTWRGNHMKLSSQVFCASYKNVNTNKKLSIYSRFLLPIWDLNIFEKLRISTIETPEMIESERKTLNFY